jgi:phosphoribosyl 1,2-cyclic phosphate phosphodiesterase
MATEHAAELVFLGSSAAIQIPAFFCTCSVCEAARHDPALRRTRASAALIGQETTLIDACPDLEFQLEREGIQRIDSIFITHWHFDHIAGLAALAEPSSLNHWPPIDVYLPDQVMGHFDRELAYMRPAVRLHPLHPGDRVGLPDATWNVVKTTHTGHSVGFIVEAAQRFAYLVDGVVPPADTVSRLNGIDLLILEASVDELLLPPGQQWLNFSVPQAIAFWKQTGVPRCILSHVSCHRWHYDRLVAGMSDAERRDCEAQNPDLVFAYDGMRVRIG